MTSIVTAESHEITRYACCLSAKAINGQQPAWFSGLSYLFLAKAPRSPRTSILFCFLYETPIAVPHIRHSRGSGNKSAGADLNCYLLARRAKYMDVFRNPVTLVHILFNLLDTRFRGYDIFFILDFHVHLQITIIWRLLLQC